tara:strand:- start:3272 stop:3553 length:282 start_codon:yes stop_codon:yes gene_type:complete
MKFKIGDLVTLKDVSRENRKHTARQCKLGVILAYEKLNETLLYKVHWWPFNQPFYFEGHDLEIASRVFLHEPVPIGGSGSISDDDDYPIGSND